MKEKKGNYKPQEKQKSKQESKYVWLGCEQH